MPVWTIVYEAAYWPLLVVLAATCWRFGNGAVRATATVLTISMLIAWWGQGPRRNHDFELFQAVSDLSVLLLLSVLSIRWPRSWLMAMAALQLLSVVGHLTKLVGYPLTRMAYAILHAGPAYPLLACLSIGLMAAIRTRRSATARSATGSRGATTKDTGAAFGSR